MAYMPENHRVFVSTLLVGTLDKRNMVKMGEKLFILLCSIAFLSQASSSSLTKEFDVNQKTAMLEVPVEVFANAIDTLRKSDVPVEMMRLALQSSNQAVANLNELLTRNKNPQAEEILDVFNAGLGVQLVTLKEDYVQIDLNALRSMASTTAVLAVRVAYPNDYFQQLIAFGVLQKTISEVSQELSPAFEELRIPVSWFTTAVSTKGNPLRTRTALDVQQRGLLETVQATVCNTVISTAYNILNSTLASYNEFLNKINVSTSDDAIQNVASQIISSFVKLAKQILSVIDQTAQSLLQSVCSGISATNSTTNNTNIDSKTTGGTAL